MHQRTDAKGHLDKTVLHHSPVTNLTGLRPFSLLGSLSSCWINCFEKCDPLAEVWATYSLLCVCFLNWSVVTCFLLFHSQSSESSDKCSPSGLKAISTYRKKWFAHLCMNMFLKPLGLFNSLVKFLLHMDKKLQEKFAFSAFWWEGFCKMKVLKCCTGLKLWSFSQSHQDSYVPLKPLRQASPASRKRGHKTRMAHKQWFKKKSKNKFLNPSSL